MCGLPSNEKASSGRQADAAPGRDEASAGDRSASDLSPLAEALASVGDRWTLLVVAALLEGPRRFNDLLGEISGIAPNILTQRLRHLERQALVVAQPYSRRPPRSVYELTEAGRQLAGALRLLADWGARHSEGVDSPRHGVCGTPMDARWYCPTCERPVNQDEADLHFL
jgi:DNA-binding HxlR family transcriptional regulator